MVHLDLFSGIGGFAYAVDQVWPGADHIFCDNDKFCQQVIAKHWPDSRIINDIRDFTEPFEADILTGGFPCQPFSAAGLRKGTDDDRYLWPEMFRVIRLTKPEWVIAENVAGLIRWNSEMVFEQICADLEAEGYEVWPLIIPALAVNAPHRRDRVWFVAHTNRKRMERPRAKLKTTRINQQTEGYWSKTKPPLPRVDDGIPNRVDRIKTLGNAIVPQVAVEIMKAISRSS